MVGLVKGDTMAAPLMRDHGGIGRVDELVRNVEEIVRLVKSAIGDELGGVVEAELLKDGGSSSQMAGPVGMLQGIGQIRHQESTAA